MEKKYLEALEEAIKTRTESLNKDKEALEKEIENLQGVSEVGEDGKLKKTKIQEDYENDLSKVVLELKDPIANSKELQKLIKKEQKAQEETKKAKLAIESLNKDKEALEKEIEKLQDVSEVGEDGKLKKTKMQELYEADLVKILLEIEQKEQIINTKQAELEEIEKSYKTLIEKYNVKIVEGKEETDKPQEQQEEKKEKDEEQKQEDNELDVPPQKVENEEKKPAVATSKTTEVSPKIETTTPKTVSQEPQTIKPENLWKVENISFYIIDGNVPCYKVNLFNGKEEKQEEFIGKEYIQFLNSEEANKLKNEGIKEADRVYDKGLADILGQIDSIYQTASLQQYKEMLKNKNLISRYPDKYKEEVLDIDYDLSELYTKPETDEEIKKLRKFKKIIKANYIEGLVSYEKAPNFLKRLWRKITTRSLPKEESYQDIMFKHYKNESNEPEFDKKKFISEMYRTGELTEKDKAELVNRINEYNQQQSVTRKREKFKKGLSADAPQDEVKEYVSSEVERILEEDKKTKKDTTIITGQVADLPKNDEGLEK